MKKLLITIAVLMAALAAPAAVHSASKPVTVLLAGGSASNVIHIWLSEDGRTFVIDSIVPFEVGGDVCVSADGNPSELLCQAARIGGFEINADGGDDRASVAKEVKVPVTMRGGPGNDTLIGGSAADKLIGGAGDDRLVGARGNDVLLGGPGNDVLLGGRGDDFLHPGPGADVIRGGGGHDTVMDRGRARNKRRGS